MEFESMSDSRRLAERLAEASSNAQAECATAVALRMMGHPTVESELGQDSTERIVTALAGQPPADQVAWIRELAVRLEQDAERRDSFRAPDSVACAFYALEVRNGRVDAIRWVIARHLEAATDEARLMLGSDASSTSILAHPAYLTELQFLETSIDTALQKSS